MSALQISQLVPVNDLNELDVLDQESINGGLFGFSFPNLFGGTKSKSKTELTKQTYTKIESNNSFTGIINAPTIQVSSGTGTIYGAIPG
ncbi:MAG: hypothetical protein AAFX80_14650 [Cyanobacteria bacterium J06639_18]